MTDNEILETFKDNCNSCEYCPYHIYSDCDERNRKDILDLIKRQQSEIDRLNSLCTSKDVIINSQEAEIKKLKHSPIIGSLCPMWKAEAKLKGGSEK